jgi:hypothetical protein
MIAHINVSTIEYTHSSQHIFNLQNDKQVTVNAEHIPSACGIEVGWN